MGGAFPAVQQLHGPIEEQARLACHPHIVLHFANRTSQAWLRSVLLAETDEAKALLRNWQEKTILAVESIMSSCAGTGRLHFEEIPFREDIDLKPQPYSEKWREEDRFDGGAEEDVKEPEKKRTSVTVVPPVVDYHIRKAMTGESATSFEETKQKVNIKHIPLTGCVMARLPHYRLPVSGYAACSCSLCAKARTDAEERSTSGFPIDAKEDMQQQYIANFCEDLHAVCALSGHLHEHKNTCFKYVVVARTGKDPLLPVWPGEGIRLTLAAMVAHRGNLNYQDCRRTLTAGFDREELDLLRDLGANSMPMSSGSSGSVPGNDLLTRQTKIIGSEATGHQQRVRFRVVITSAFILANEFWTYQGLQWIGNSEVRDRAQKRAAQFLTPYLDGLMCKRLSRTCLALYRLEFERTGAADANRVGDRFLSPECRLLHGYVKECVVESIRTGIQTSFYTCAYTTKPSMTCGPMLKHLTHGMKNLEEKMQAEAEQEEAQRLQLAYPLPAVREGRGLTAEQREARRRLCRLWTSANHAVMHGFCLMSLQLMTGREVLRTHIFWRIMMKRVLWGVFEEMRRNAEKLADSFELQTTAAVEDIELPPAGTQAADTRATSFYEDYLHRGIAEPLASMNLYVYAVHVSAVPLQEAGKFDHGEFDFSEHYVKAKTHVQVLHAAPRIPYLHGISMPTKQKDPDMWAAVHIALLRKHCCEDENVCGQASAVRHIHIFPGKSRVRVVSPGNDARIVRDSTGVLAEWKATEARVQCLADRADVVDVTALRQYKVPGTVENCDVLESLLKMFTESNRPKTRRTWKQGRRKRTVCSTVPLVSERILGNIFDYVGHLTTEDGEAVLLGNSPEHFDTCVLHRPDLAAAKRCSYGWHNEQLTAAEYVATISREISANLDFMAEARRRPRPGVLHPTATDEKEDVGLQGEFVNVEDVDDIQDPDADDVDQDTSLRPDIQYKPILHVASNDLFDMVHRRNVGSGRASASTKRSEEFLRQYGGKYLDMKESRPCARAPDTDVQRRATFNVVAGLKAQKFLQESRKEKDEKLMDASKDEFLPGNASLLEVPVSMAPETEVLVLSPADMALRLLQQRLPTRQADGTYQISPDQYKACVLAIAPLQKLWVKAGEHDLQHCFGARGRLRELLALALGKRKTRRSRDADDVAEASHVAVDTALQSLPGFPAAHQLPKPIGLDKTGGFVYEDNVWLLAVSKTQQPDVGNRKRPWPGKSTADRTMFCQSWQLRLSTLSRAADDYLLREHRLRAFAADAGAGGDCFFLSVAAALETLRAEQHNLPLSLEQLFSVDVSRGAMVRRLRGIVGQGVMNWGPKQFLDFATTCLANEVAGMWLDSWKMSRLIANTPFAFLQGVNSVHDLTLDAANALILHCKHGESPNLVQHRIDAGRDVLTKMQRAVADNISQVCLSGVSCWRVSGNRLMMDCDHCSQLQQKTRCHMDFRSRRRAVPWLLLITMGLGTSVSDVAVAGKKGCFFSASRDRSIRRWDCKTLESDLQLAHAQGDWLTALALSVSEEVLFSGGKDSIIKVWDGDLHCKDMLQGHRGPISDLLTIDNHLFSASHDRTVRVWKIDHFDT
ncbi:unnamed protein product [Cladocopium goreaui]|uniref:Kinesin-like protein KIF21A (Kinesin-like protein KIF2) (Renal carcinoma antigen NY-REN-62) n=1 Tax=Cladocopium goreaui TaxID=2562237 RepID=A0A9P1CYE1_9DINO|nr:unnamed protein product [Cladocopium goreaui]